MSKWNILSGFSIFLAGCTHGSLNNALGTPKNPTPVFLNPVPPKGEAATEQAIILPLYNVLLEANDKSRNNPQLVAVGTSNMRRYLAAGFALSDVYCTRFFVKTDEAYRRRRFGRTLTNDVGTVMTTVLGLANAGENLVTGLAGAVGFADSAWRNYDDSFVVSPDLSNVQSLVFAAQDNFRARTLAKNVDLPTDYGTAQSSILRYANLCSFLGMKGLLDQSAAKQKNDLNANTEAVKAGKANGDSGSGGNGNGGNGNGGNGKGGNGGNGTGAAPNPPAGLARPEIATPSLAPNKGN